MQFFDRSVISPPAAFQGQSAQDERLMFYEFLELDPARQAQSPPPARRFEIDADVMTALDRLFESKCAFCEARVPLNIHLFRPPEEASPLISSEMAHLYYVWLRTDWGNHYPICEGCARGAYRQFPVQRGKRGRLPTTGEFEAFAKEGSGLWREPHRDSPLLLDPCATSDFKRHFSVDLEGNLDGRTAHGRATIEVFSLDREALVRERAHVYRQYLDLLHKEIPASGSSAALDFARIEFGGTWNLLLRRILDETERRLDRSLPKEKAKLRDTLAQLLRSETGREAFDAATAAVRSPEKLKPVRPPGPRRVGSTLLTSIELRNFKALEKITVEIPGPVAAEPAARINAEAAALLILGENATGKSSLLEAVALALCGEPVRGNLKPPRAFLLDPEMMGAPGEPRLRSAEVRLGFDDASEIILGIDDAFTDRGTERRPPPVFAYGAFRQYGRGRRRPIRYGHVGTLFVADAILPNPEAWLLGLSPPRFAMVVRALRDIFSVEGEFDVIEPDPQNDRCLLVTRLDGDAGGEPMRTPLAAASSGYRSVLAMVCDILAGVMGPSEKNTQPIDETRAIILIDEIEAHLHPRWKMQIMRALRQVFPQSVIIATTHDPLCLRGMHDGEVVVFNRVRSDGIDHAMPTQIEVRADLPDVENLTVEQLLTSDLFEMFSTDSPGAERKLAEFGALLAKRQAGRDLEPDEEEALAVLQRDVSDALPLGSSKVQAMILSAVGEFLAKRRSATDKQLAALEEEARQGILRALENY